VLLIYSTGQLEIPIDLWDKKTLFLAKDTGISCRIHIMNPKKIQPVSRDLVRIIKENSKLESSGCSLNEHLRSIDERQSKALEFYLRACALRLDKSA